MVIWKRGNLKGPFNKLVSYLDITFSDHGLFRLFWRSWGELPGKMYRCNQPYPFQLSRDIKKYNIKSILNLRGERNCSSYFLEKEFCDKNKVSLYNFPVSSRDLPSKKKVLDFFKLLNKIQYPCIMHCKSGADRAGLASVLYMIYKQKKDVSVAIEQLNFKHLHIKYAKTGILDFFFNHAIKIEKNGHKEFIDWVKNDYNKDKLKNKFNYNGFFSFLVEKVLRRE